MDGIIEIRTYTLKEGTREKFHALVESEVMPLLNKWKLKVVSYGPSLHDNNTYHLIRSFPNLNLLNQSEEAFYSSQDWIRGPREAILNLISSYSTLVIPARSYLESKEAQPDDLKMLQQLNAQFIRNFVNQDTVAHAEIIHPDFLCIENSGAIVGRKQYMADWTHAYSDGRFKSFTYKDEHIRLFGNTALIRSRTEYTKLVEGKEIHGSSVYTDTYIKEQGRWWCVQAQITPIK
jgi:ketosteroid isomerase-like protein